MLFSGNRKNAESVSSILQLLVESLKERVTHDEFFLILSQTQAEEFENVNVDPALKLAFVSILYL